MNFLDIAIIVLWSGFIFYGWFFGLIKAIGSMLSIILGGLIAYLFYDILFSLVNTWFFGLDNIGLIICFLFLWIISYRLLQVLFTLLDKTFNILSIIPFLKSIKKISGAIFGFLEGFVIMGGVIYFLNKSYFLSEFLGDWWKTSQLWEPMIKTYQTTVISWIDDIWNIFIG